jgi:hypothetical protein
MACNGIRLCARVANGLSWGQVAEFPLIHLLDLGRSGWQVPRVPRGAANVVCVLRMVIALSGARVAARMKRTQFLDARLWPAARRRDARERLLHARSEADAHAAALALCLVGG